MTKISAHDIGGWRFMALARKGNFDKSAKAALSLGYRYMIFNRKVHDVDRSLAENRLVETGLEQQDFKVPSSPDKRYSANQVLFVHSVDRCFENCPQAPEEVVPHVNALGYEYFVFGDSLYRINGDLLVQTEWIRYDVAC